MNKTIRLDESLGIWTVLIEYAKYKKLTYSSNVWSIIKIQKSI